MKKEAHPEQFARIQRLIGKAALQRLHRAHVTVVGLGAVGSYAVEALTRAGVGRLRVVDFDVVQPSNLNRQLYALRSTVGQRKVDLACQRIQDINPGCEVEGLPLFAHLETMDQILAGPPDLVVDAIDSLNPKVNLLAEALNRKIPIVSSMGAAMRTDPSCVRVGPLAQVAGCPLARRVRKFLRRRCPTIDLTCVYSVERIPDLPEDEEEGPLGDQYGRGRPRRPMGSLPTLTGMFGLALANAALCQLLGGTFKRSEE